MDFFTRKWAPGAFSVARSSHKKLWKLSTMCKLSTSKSTGKHTVVRIKRGHINRALLQTSDYNFFFATLWQHGQERATALNLIVVTF